MQEMSDYSNRRCEATVDRRSARRIDQFELQCSLGRVLDITSAGMRVICRRIPKKKPIKFDLNTTVDPVPVQVEVVWAKWLGPRKYEVGLRFVEPSPELGRLIRCCSTLDGKSFYISQS